MYRLCSNSTGEHFYTSSVRERDYNAAHGWTYEGVAWYAPEISNTPVYRLHFPGGDHHYTMSLKERNYLIGHGWIDEGIGWYSDDAKGVAVYRQSYGGKHNYSVSEKEKNYLTTKAGWTDEGIGWYGMKEDSGTDNTSPQTPDLHKLGRPGFKYAGVFECTDSQVGSSKPRLILDDDGYCELYAVMGANNTHKYMGYYEYGEDTSEYADQGAEIRLYMHFPGEDASHRYAEATYDGEADVGYIYFQTPGFGLMGGDEYHAGYFSRISYAQDPSEKPSEEPTPVNPTPEKPKPEEPTPENPTPAEPTPENPTPEEPTPEDPTPENPTPENPTPGEPTPENPSQDSPLDSGVEVASAVSYITLGAYEQDNDLLNKAEPIEWLVVGKRDGHTLLVSRYALDCKKYDEDWVDTTWENCDLREWLNNDFYNTAFTPADQSRIVTAHNQNPDSYELFKTRYANNKTDGAKGGNATDDKVFLLSWTEARDAFGGALYQSSLGKSNYNQKLLCRPSAYELAHGIGRYHNQGYYPEDSDQCCTWWLRSPGSDQKHAAVVAAHGSLQSNEITGRYVGVRPAILID